jgi:hypothetical protein
MMVTMTSQKNEKNDGTNERILRYTNGVERRIRCVHVFEQKETGASQRACRHRARVCVREGVRMFIENHARDFKRTINSSSRYPGVMRRLLALLFVCTSKTENFPFVQYHYRIPIQAR